MADFLFFVEVLVGGLLSGVMYSLVAIGFVLIYKTSGVLNFAQGAMVLFAALTFVSLVEHGFPFGGALAITLAAMVAARLRHRAHGAAAAGQPLADDAVHGDARPLLHHRGRGAADLGHAGARARPRHRRHAASRSAGVFICQFDLVAARIAGGMVAVLTAFFRYTRIGLAFRAVADDQFAALAVGLRLPRIWAHGLDRGRLRRAGRRPALGRAARRAVLAVADRAQGAAGAGARRLRLRSSAPSSAA